MKTTAILFRNEEGQWTLSSYKGDTIPSTSFPTAAAARAYAKAKKMSVRRASNCDA
jgi:hypothetical protein